MAIRKDGTVVHARNLDDETPEQKEIRRLDNLDYDRRSLDGVFINYNDTDYVFRPPNPDQNCQECVYCIEKSDCWDCYVMLEAWAGSQILGPEPDSFTCPFKNPCLMDYVKDAGVSVIGVEGWLPKYTGYIHWLFYSKNREACLKEVTRWIEKLKELRPELFCVLFDAVIEEYI